MRAKINVLVIVAATMFSPCIPIAKSADAEPDFGELSRLANKYDTDKGTCGTDEEDPRHSYTDMYELFFYPIKQSARKIFEIGIDKGASLKMWKDYFPQAIIYGIDITNSTLGSERIKTYVADQSKRSQLKIFIDTFGDNFDMILDDGGHTMEQQQVSFGYLFKHVRAGGYYIIEDVHTSLGKDWGAEGGGLNTTLEHFHHSCSVSGV